MSEGTQRIFFIGVSTRGSSIMKLFPIWAEVLGLQAEVEGRDLPIAGPPHVYRDAVVEIANRDDVRGALVTTHKVDVFRHARDLFFEVDEHALLCKEISSISKAPGGLVGHAKDPITAGKAMERIFGDRPPHEVLCLGAGGAGTAISVYLLGHPRPPRRMAIVDRDRDRIEGLRAILSSLQPHTRIEYLVHDAPQDNDGLLAAMPDGSFIVNATGMGKDVPGSPLSAEAVFPPGALVWELNYRGELGFLRQAAAQARERGLEVHDGWHYFLYGWSEVVAEVFGLRLDGATMEGLERAAEPLRP